MSDSVAALRKGVGDDLRDLAEQHYKHESVFLPVPQPPVYTSPSPSPASILEQEDRDRLQSAAGKVSRYASIGSLLGLGLGVALAFRIRKNRLAYFTAFRAIERPEAVVFPGGRTEKIPDITPLLKPTTPGDIVTYTFFSIAGIFLGGETGLLVGSAAASRTITSDPASRRRIETAFRKFKADALRRQADELDGGEGSLFS
ncbi:hypothetical protein EPUS_08829 [Endocarpon pusillum Z07020]|uniref:Uncharacterized protein n=1 Tax=Endocarpon pusillum (strain Z07020 / HMAS-L-300199) TaxID=1263415 RepID=U1GCC9_ENDPU|nr:uncharacterized protein EPUS_08829 [Endocarpon pusillum Z07020]ERF69356.1 hypothetical protein EPUS_08829 [Endocarpon pusillum Z07020]